MWRLIANSVVGALASVLIAVGLFAQPEVEWDGTYGGAREDICWGCTQTADGGYVLVGLTFSFGAPHAGDGWAIRVDSEGDSVWARRYGGDGYDNLGAVLETEDGDLMLAGVTPVRNYPFWLMKCDSDGEIIWSQTYGEDYGTNVKALFQTADGGFLLAGHTENGFMAVRTQSDGQQIWREIYDSGGSEYLLSAIMTSDGGYLLMGQASFYGEYSGYLVKINDDGEVQWSLTEGIEGQNLFFYGAAESEDGSFIVSEIHQLYFVSEDGEVTGTQELDEEEHVRWLYGILPSGDGGYTLIAENDDGDYSLIRTAADFTVLWRLTLEVFDEVIKTADEGFAVGGTFGYYEDSDFYLAKIGSDPELGIPNWRNIPAASMQEDGELVLSNEDLLEYLTDADDPDSSIALDVEGGAHLAAEIIGDEVIVTSDPDWWGVDSIGLTAFDPAGHSGETMLTVSVLPMNDPPGSFNLLAPENGWVVNTRRIAFVWNEAEQNEYETDPISYTLRFVAGGYHYSIEDLTECYYLVMDYRDLLTEMGIPDSVDMFVVNWSVTACDDSSETACLKPFRMIFQRRLGVGDEAVEPSAFSLLPPFPNPFNSRAELVFGLERQSWTTLRIYDYTGHLLERLYEGVLSSGRHNVVWDASGVPAGIYLGRLESGGRSAMVKLAVVR